MVTITVGVCLTALVAVGLALFYAASVPHSQVFGPALVRGPGEGMRVALTFDDGPASPFTEQILDILCDRQVPATFFVCGQNVERYPEIVRRLHRDGHTLGNHTFSHPFLCFCRPESIAEEIERTQQVVEKVVGVRPEIFRPPYGVRWFGLYPVLRERGLRLVQWSDTGYDWKNAADAIVRETLRNLRPGGVIVLHDGREVRPPETVDRANTVKALPGILDGATKAGYKFVSVHEFLCESFQV